MHELLHLYTAYCEFCKLLRGGGWGSKILSGKIPDFVAGILLWGILSGGILSWAILSFPIFWAHKIWGILSGGNLSWRILSHNFFFLGDFVAEGFCHGVFCHGGFCHRGFCHGGFFGRSRIGFTGAMILCFI